MITSPPVRRFPARGRVRSRIEALERLVLPPVPVEVIPPHPLPDLTGATAEEIGDALCAAITEAYGDNPLWNTDTKTGRLCRRCKATLEVAVGLASRLVERDEMARWTKIRPDATFDRAAWRADRDRQRAEHFYTDHYRGQIPRWVISQA